jgi:hypothetical protein
MYDLNCGKDQTKHVGYYCYFSTTAQSKQPPNGWKFAKIWSHWFQLITHYDGTFVIRKKPFALLKILLGRLKIGSVLICLPHRTLVSVFEWNRFLLVWRNEAIKQGILSNFNLKNAFISLKYTMKQCDLSYREQHCNV